MLLSNIQLVRSSFKRKKKLGLKDETHENIDDKFDGDDMYEIDKPSLDEKK